MKLLVPIVALVAVLGIVWLVFVPRNSTITIPTPGETGTTVTTPDGVTVMVPADFAIATSKDQLSVHSYIPACDEGFNYCVYYNTTTYASSTFEAAGLRIQKRPDIATEATCVKTPPTGYDKSTRPAASSTTDTYATSVFSPLSDAGAGHFANGALYRLFIKATGVCEEFETRVGETQFANYPPGAIKEFTATDRTVVMKALDAIVRSVKIDASTEPFRTTSE